MNKFIREYFETLNSRGVLYCHWKSNNTLDEALNGIGDLDLLIDPRYETVFSEVCAAFGFKLVKETKAGNPYVYHYYGLDCETGKLYHLHVYFKLVTGGAVLKNYHIPLEQAFLRETTMYKDLVPIPVKEVDLALFVIRKTLEQTSPLEHLLYLKDQNGISKELDWLSSGYDEQTLSLLLEKYLPFLSLALFNDSHKALGKSSFLKRYRLGWRMHMCFSYTVRHPIKAMFVRNFSFLIIYMKGKLGLHRPSKTLFPGGMIIAFVGAEASGKSTLSTETAKWLGEKFDVTHVHLGKPPKAFVAKCLWPLIWIYVQLKRLLKKTDNFTVDTDEMVVKADELYIPHPVVAWLNAMNRAALARKIFRESMAGKIIVTDRYPMTVHLQPDGPCLSEKGFWGRMLAKHEASIYARIPRPDVAIQAHAPLVITQERNAAREMPEPERFVKVRHARAEKISFPDSVSYLKIDTTRPFNECFKEIKCFVWKRDTE